MRTCDKCKGSGKLPDKLRSLPQNSRYWVTLTHYLGEMNKEIGLLSGETGYTPLEIKRLIAQDMMPEHVAILLTTRTDSAHDIIKQIAGIKTSTNKNTKEFMEFEETMENALAEVMSSVNAFKGRAA